jgi:hypothetical protein
MSKHRDYGAAQAALGVKKVEISSLLRKHKDFRARSCEAFEAFLAPKGHCTRQHWYGKSHLGYVDPVSQGIYCAWFEALLCVPSLLLLGERNTAREAALCANWLQIFRPKVSAEALLTGTADEDSLERWEAWQAALEFGLVTIQQPV